MSNLKFRNESSDKAKVILMVNDKDSCNRSCTHCYLPYEGVRSPENVLELVENLRDEYRVVVAGSELLNDIGYLEAMQAAGQKYILTNGLLLHHEPELFDKLTEYGIDQIQISLHFGIDEDLNSVPERIVREVVKEAKERGFSVNVAVTITADNYKNVADMCRYVYEMKADGILLFRYVKPLHVNEEDVSVMTDEQREEFISLTNDTKDLYGVEDLYISIHSNFGPRLGTEGKKLSFENEYCPAGENLFAIDPNGNVYSCPFLMNTPIGVLTKDFKIEIDQVLGEGRRDKCLTDFV